jgi:hypothetical protein
MTTRMIFLILMFAPALALAQPGAGPVFGPPPKPVEVPPPPPGEEPPTVGAAPIVAPPPAVVVESERGLLSTPVGLHANAGVEILGGSNVTSSGLRTHLGIDKSVGTSHVQPDLALGVTFSYAALGVSDARALDGTVSIGYRDWGPEAQLGLRWVDGGIVDTRVFASFSYLRVDLDSRLMLDAVEGVGGNRGMRATIGATWADRVFRDRGENSGLDWLLLFAPQQVEAGWLRSAGSDRYGVTLSWGF